MKNLLFLVMALFLLFVSCQKEELEIPKEETQEIVYSFNLDKNEEAFAIAGVRPPRPCSCTLNVSANRNNTGGGSNSDWRAWVKFSDGTFAARFGGPDVAYDGSVSSTSFADELGTTQSISFLPPTSSFDLRIAFPTNPSWDPGIAKASVTCLYANQSGGVSFTWTSLNNSISGHNYGSINNCSVYPPF